MRSHPVLGVLSGCGGAGASTLAAWLAQLLARGGPSLLIDCDPLGGGIDVLLGCERTPGPRWGQVRLRGGDLDPAVLLEALPRWGPVAFLAADSAQSLDGGALAAVIDAATNLAPVVLDLPRAASPARVVGADRSDLSVVVTPAEVRGVTASAVLCPGLDPDRTGVVVRGTSKALAARHIGALLGLPVLAELPWDPAAAHENGLASQRMRRRTDRAVRAVIRAAEERRSQPVPPTRSGTAA